MEAPSAADRIRELEFKVEALQRFKNYVHDYLDRQGVPHHPPGTHGAAGCRIGDRMDWLMEQYRDKMARADAATPPAKVVEAAEHWGGGGQAHSQAFVMAKWIRSLAAGGST